MYARALVVSLALLASSTAQAQLLPSPPKPGKETMALAPLVGAKKRAGQKRPPMVPPVDFTGTFTCGWTAGELWLACDIDDVPKGGTLPRFRAHLIVGWDFQAKAYRGYLASTQGGGLVFTGQARDGKLVLESDDFNTPMGKMRARWTFDLRDPKAIQFTDERSMNGMPFFQLENSALR